MQQASVLASARPRPVHLRIPLAAAMVAVLVIPLLLAATPPLMDYPNHLARIWLIGGGAGVAPVSAMVQVKWDTLTNIGIDLAAWGLTQLLTYDAVGRLFVCAAILLGPLGGMVLWRALHGRAHWWQWSFGLLAWGMGLFLGFLNFEIGLGLALLAAAADPALARRGRLALLAGRVVLAGGLLLMHAFALVFYAALLGALAIGPDSRFLLHWPTLRRIARAILLAAVPLAVPVLLLVLLAPSLPGQQTGTNLQTAAFDVRQGLISALHHPASKLEGAFLGIRSYAKWIDGLTLLALSLPVLLSLWLRRLSAHAGMLIAVALLLLCYLCTPTRLAGTYWIDARFAWMLPFALAAALRPDLPPRLARLAAAALFAVFVLRTSLVAYVWHQRQADLADLSTALALVPEGAAVLPLVHQTQSGQGVLGRDTTVGGFASYGHLAALAVPLRHAFVPTLFAARGKQPLQVKPPFDQIADPEGGTVASADALDDPGVYAESLPEAPYLAAWRTRFDYALVLNADVADQHGAFTAPAGLEPLKTTGFAQLYRIKHAS